MSRETLDAALRGLLPRLHEPARVKLFGGEPLLRPDLVRHALAYICEHAPGAEVELPTNGGGLPKVAGLLRRHPEVEVFVSRPDALAASLPNAVYSFLLPPGQTPVEAARRLVHARRLGFSRFNFLPAYFVAWTPAQLSGLAACFQALSVVLRRWAEAGRPAEVVNLSRAGSTPLYNDGYVVDADGQVYSSNLVLAEAVRPSRARLRLGRVGGSMRLRSRAPGQAARVLEDSFPPAVLQATMRADAALMDFCLRLEPVGGRG